MAIRYIIKDMEGKKQKRNIYLTGFMTSGKSSVGLRLAAETGRPFVETDDLVCRKAGMTIPDIFEQAGEEAFRTLETQVLRDLVSQDGLIVSCGGGLPLKEENRKLIRASGTIVLLTVHMETVLKRMGKEARPLLDALSPEEIRSLMKAREKAYLSAYDIKLATDERSIESLVAAILSRLV